MDLKPTQHPSQDICSRGHMRTRATHRSPSYFVSAATLPVRCLVAREHVPGRSDLGNCGVIEMR